MKEHIGIVGAGVIGLTSALVLSEAGYPISIVARELPGDLSMNWASPWAAAAIFLHHTSDKINIQTQIDSFKFFLALALRDTSSGIQTVKATEYWDQNEPAEGVWFETMAPDFKYIPENELPLGVRMGYTYTSTVINPKFYLPWLKNLLVRKYGVQFIQAEVQTFLEARTLLGCEKLINASGMGAKTLAGDENVRAVRGQTMLVSCPPDVNGKSVTEEMNREAMIRRGSEYTYVISRCFTDSLIIGGIIDYENKSTDVDIALQRDILKRVNVMTRDRFAGLDLQRDVRENIVAFRPDRVGGRRIEIGGEDGVVHAYGFGSSGYQYSYGSALRVRRLVDELCKPVSARL